MGKQAGRTDLLSTIDKKSEHNNSQGELDPLEIGIHAFEAVPTSEGGKGKKGGVSDYARKIGKRQPDVSNYRSAGEVIKGIEHSIGLESLLGKASHLAAIHKLPRECWQVAVKWLCVTLSKVDKVTPPCLFRGMLRNATKQKLIGAEICADLLGLSRNALQRNKKEAWRALAKRKCAK